MIWIFYFLLGIYLISVVGVGYLAYREKVNDYNRGESLYLTEVFWLVLGVFIPLLNTILVIDELDLKNRLSDIVLIKGKNHD